MEEKKVTMIYEGQGYEIRNPIKRGSIYQNIPFEVSEGESIRILKYPGFKIVEEIKKVRRYN